MAINIALTFTGKYNLVSNVTGNIIAMADDIKSMVAKIELYRSNNDPQLANCFVTNEGEPTFVMPSMIFYRRYIGG